jgi:hypothetical protein
MPGRDRTGPMGAGPMTGRAAGLCTGNMQPGYGGGFRGNAWCGQGFGAGLRGRRFGGRNFIPASVSKADESEILKNQAEYLKASLNEVNRRIDELKQTEEKQQ